MKKTRVCSLLGIEYPIIQGAIGRISGVELASAVSNAGGLGTITLLTDFEEEWQKTLRQRIRAIKQQTDKPFQVNLGLGSPRQRERIDIALEEGVTIFTTLGNPAEYTRYLKSAGTTVIHVVATVKQAKKAEAEGVDLVVASGFEGGGHVSRYELTTFVLVPLVADAVKIPLIAAGGIADVRGLAAALALGAEGVQMGTRFVVTQECVCHPSYKNAILKATETDTIVTGTGALAPTRILRNDFANKVLDMERRGIPAEELQAYIGLGRIAKACVEGDMEEGSAPCGAVCGMIKDIISVRDIIHSFVTNYNTVVSKLQCDKLPKISG